MLKEIKQKRCLVCREPFTPKRIGNTMRMTKHCGNAGCELDYSQGITKAPKPKAKPKLRKVSVIKAELWDLFSLHQKLVHSSDGKWCNCYTCDKPIEIGTIDCQGGHAFSKAANPALWFDERAVRPQCSRCNCAEEGNHYIFNERLKQEIGMAAWQDMYDGRKQIRTGGRQIYLQKIEYYKAEVARLKALKSAN
jgi:hypothetical protein